MVPVGELTVRAGHKARVIAVSSLGLLSTVASLSGCSGGEEAASSPKPSTSASHATTGPAKPSSDRPEHIPGESVTEAPKLPYGKTLAEVASAHGNQTVELSDGIDAGALSVLVNCQGKGSVTISVKPINLTFALECVEGEVSSTYNELSLKQAREQASLSVTAPSTVRWALTVGQ